ncbi:MAG TPA: cupin domain-containing protein [Terriglobia bacterium]|nr:cupin domain-containing protein [Terriglobia bacterium]
MHIGKASVILGSASVLLAFLAGYAAGQRQPPAQNVGQSEELLRTIDLTNELDSVKGRQLRMRKITLQPGGALALHNHVGRPAVTYLLQGEVTYRRQDRPDQVLRPGGGFAEGRATTHWAENTGKVPAVWIAVDIPTP